MGHQARFRAVLAVREFRALWIAESLSIVGDQLARVALSVLVYQRTSSAGWTALTYALTLVPSMLGGALLSGLADRRPRRELMVSVDILRAIVAGAMALPFVPLPVVMALVFLLTLAAGPFKAAQQALLPSVLHGELYITGLALRQVTGQSAQLAGFAGGGLLLTIMDTHTALGINAITFILAAVIVRSGVQHRPAAGIRGDREQHAVGGGTVRFLWRDRTTRGLLALAWLVGLFVVPEGLAAPYAAGLGASTAAVGILMAADPAGSVIGAWLLSRVPAESRPALLTPLAVAAGVPLTVCFMHPGLLATLLLWASSGACSTAYLILAQAEFTLRVPDSRRGAASGIASTGVLSSQGLAIFGAGLLADATTPALTVASTGAAGAVLAGLVAASWLRRRSSRSRASVRTGDCEAGMDGVTSPSSSSAPPPAEHAAEHGTGGADRVIIARQDDPPSSSADQQHKALRGWTLWQIPRRVLIFIVTVEAGGAGLTAVMALRGGISRNDYVTFAVILGLGLAMGEMSRHVERIRRRFADTPHVNLTSVWTIPASLLLPPILTAAVVLGLYLHLFWRSWYRVRGVHAYRLTFSAIGAVIAAYAAWTVFHTLAPAGLLRWHQGWMAGAALLAALAYSATNSSLIGGAISLFDGRFKRSRALGTGRENALEFGTLGMGVANSVLIAVHPAWTLVMIPALLVLHRSALLRQYEEAAATDPKTGLTNAAAWSNAAAKELQRCESVGVLMVDIDYFKTVDDTHGHLVGDEVLKAVATALTKAVRHHDLVGRMGGDEFTILCPEVSAEELVHVGERICEVVRGLRVTVSIPGHAGIIDGLTISVGAARFPDFGPDLEDVLLAADNALLVAKEKGRNQVRTVLNAVGRISAPRSGR